MAGEGGTVLVVDDDASLRVLCRVNLELDGYRVLEAASAEGARQALAGEHVDVVLLDVTLGGGEDGLSLLRELRRHAGGPAVALFTGSDRIGEADRSLADGILWKPFSPEDLSAAVRRAGGSARGLR